MGRATIKCPRCGEAIELTEAISHDIEIELRKKYEKEVSLITTKAKKDMADREHELEEKIKKERQRIFVKAKREAEESIGIELSDLKEQLTDKKRKLQELQEQELAMRKRERDIGEKEKNLDLQFEEQKKEIQEKLRQEKSQIAEKAKKEAETTMRLELSDLKEQLNEKNGKLEEAYQQEIALRKKQSELEDKEKYLELEINRKLDVERNRIREVVLRDAEEKHRLKEAEKNKQLADMAKQIDELKRKAEQGSQQAQGEVLELELEELLKNEFPFDQIEPIEKGIKGADILQTVKTQSGRTCGKILWETKRTKRWSDAWLQKLKDDQRGEKADLAVLVSEILPEGFRNFRQIKDVWVTDVSSAISLGLALRVTLNQVSRARQLQIGKNEKMEIVYNYLTGSEFKNRVEAIIEGFSAMKYDIDVEKRAMAKRWAAKEKQIEKVIYNIAGMHGDLEGMVGSSLPAVKMLELPSDKDKSEDIEGSEKE